MNGKAKTVIGMAAALAAFIGAAVFAYSSLSKRVEPQIEIGQSQSQTASETTEESKPEQVAAPDFTVEDGEGNLIKLSDLVGTPVVLNFWASWCPPCKEEMPEFDKVWKELQPDVAFMMVDLVDGQRETKEIGMQYVEENGFSFPVYYDVLQKAAFAYGISSIPMTIFIDSDGYVVTYARGMIDEQTLRKGIEMIFSEG